jgi:transglutaminase-like putative cysteine protease
MARTEQYGRFLRESRYVPFSPGLRKFFWSVRPSLEEDLTDYTERMISYVRDQFDYDRGTTHVHSTVDDILSAGGGVCQDFAHLNIGLLRLAGIPLVTSPAALHQDFLAIRTDRRSSLPVTPGSR